MNSNSSEKRGRWDGPVVPVLVVLLAFLAGFLVLPYLDRQRVEGPRELAPEFSLPLVEAKETTQRMALSGLRGQVVVLDFWATWCQPCRAQMPALSRLAKEHARDVVVLGVDQAEPPSTVRQFLAQHDAGYPLLADEDGAVGASYGVNSLPTLVIVDPKGRVFDVTHGVTSYARLERLVVAAGVPR